MATLLSAAPAPLPSSAAAPRIDVRPLIRWLHAVAALVVLIVVVGGITRLTESGLSITEWKPVAGALPPLTDAAWQAEFAKYRLTTEFQTEHRWMQMADFQFIYFWEWAHRLLGRLIGAALLLPLLWFAWKRRVPAGYGWRLFALAALVGLQGTVGWWMVSSGLVGRTDVSHYRLATHLLIALFILAGLIWTASDLRRLARGDDRPARIGWPVGLALGTLGLQILWGAWVAGLNAGHAFAEWPTMGGRFVPDVAFTLRGFMDDPIQVQFVHRWLAFVAAGAMVWLGVKAMRAGERTLGGALHGLVFLQIVLGIATLLSGVALWIGVAHQGVAALLVLTATRAAHVADR